MKNGIKHFLYFSWDAETTFWISNNEVIVKINKEIPEAGFIAHQYQTKPANPLQYVKLKIKELQ